MNETQLILDALNAVTPQRRKKRIMREIEPDPVASGNDAIWKLSTKTKSKTKNKTLSKWTGKDFLRHVRKNLSQFGLMLENSNIRDADMVNRLYDILASYLQEKMSNKVLKDYFDWWCGAYARYTNGPIYVQTFMKDQYVESFLETNGFTAKFDFDEKPVCSSDTKTNISDDSLYKIGGLPMVIMSKGIVVAHNLLKQENKDKAISSLLTTMQSFSKNIVEDVIQITIASSPYNFDELVDFMSIARPSLKYHRIKKFDGLNYRDYFRSVN